MPCTSGALKAEAGTWMPVVVKVTPFGSPLASAAMVRSTLATSMGWASSGPLMAMPLTEAVLKGRYLLLSEPISSAVGMTALATTAVCHVTAPCRSWRCRR